MRYSGQTTGQRAWDRHHNDCSSRSSGYTNCFLQKTTQMFPHIIKGTVVEEITPTKAHDLTPQQLLDVREQVMIALFGDGCLNVEARGKHLFVIQEDEQHAFESLRTESTKLLRARSKPCSKAVRQFISTYGMDVQAYANAHPTTGTNILPIMDDMKQVIIEQVLP
ncbi:hypothetical protein P154DRAFT_622691 [Amniculicola lignicola CBS 123094]|uniref:Uncharacterized protein n=1 Tax=Amniculicola lignicola CBS 123094 TaxID=1392246 RepID=A0A6A5W6X5_9PLEO|nr:hypothetical protein P154DRAFT_622691 [Amniculicola lignicola CBS 123094]